MRWWERTWVAGIVTLVVATSTGIVGDLWPFAAWSMFSGEGPRTSDLVVVVAVASDGTEQIHADARLPGGYLRDRYQYRFERSSPEQQRSDCRRMLADLRQGEPVDSVRLERWEWSLVDREDTPPSEVEREELLSCR